MKTGGIPTNKNKTQNSCERIKHPHIREFLMI